MQVRESFLEALREAAKQHHTSDFGSHPLNVRSLALTIHITIPNETYKNFNAPLIAS
jgi:hypothetical protein